MFKEWLLVEEEFAPGATVSVPRSNGTWSDDWKILKYQGRIATVGDGRGATKAIPVDELVKRHRYRRQQLGDRTESEQMQQKIQQYRDQKMKNFNIVGPISNSGRDIVVMDVPGSSRQAFYRSTGFNSHMKGTWLPFDGLMHDGRFAKEAYAKGMNQGDPYYRLGNPRIAQASKLLAKLSLPAGQETEDVNTWLRQNGVTPAIDRMQQQVTSPQPSPRQPRISPSGR